MSDIMVLISWAIVFMFGVMVGQNRQRACKNWFGMDVEDIFDREYDESDKEASDALDALENAVEVSNAFDDLEKARELVGGSMEKASKFVLRMTRKASDLIHARNDLTKDFDDHPDEPEVREDETTEETDEETDQTEDEETDEENV